MPVQHSKVAARRPKTSYVSTTNACKLCAPLGACIAFAGVEGAISLIHGSQGCGTYIRRYVISHFNEPIDIASSNFSESSTIFGGAPDLKLSLENVTKKYSPSMIGVCTSCLAETIGDDVSMPIKDYLREAGPEHPVVVHVSTPSYAGMHMDGFHNAVRAIVESLAKRGPRNSVINVMPGLVSPADIRHLKEMLADLGQDCIILPDYSDTLDGPAASKLPKLAPGGTPLAKIRQMGQSMASIHLGLTENLSETAAGLLHERFGVQNFKMAHPIGVNQTDRFFRVLQQMSGKLTPRKYRMERGRLVDSYVDGHKYVFGKRAIVYGEEDLVVGIASFLDEIGIAPALCASGGESGDMAASIKKVIQNQKTDLRVMEGVDFYDIAKEAESLQPDLIIGNSKGYQLARKLNIPLVRVGFPIHDRLGGQRILHIGYRGAQFLFDSIVNSIIEKKQDESPVGYSYM